MKYLVKFDLGVIVNVPDINKPTEKDLTDDEWNTIVSEACNLAEDLGNSVDSIEPYDDDDEDNTKLVKTLRRLVSESEDGYIEVYCPGNPPVLDEETVTVDDYGLTRNCGEDNEMSIPWDDLEDSDIDFLTDYIPELI